MFNYYHNVEQEQRELQAIEAREDRVDSETDLYNGGQFDAVIGGEPNPDLASKLAYRQGYTAGFWRFYDKKYGIETESEF